MLLSIIIPAYNVEQYIKRCIVSCLNQNIDKSKYEIIVVNDGSKDNSRIIAEQIASENSNIIVINQDNQGLSAARNAGLSKASGDYVWFVDSDDWIHEDCLLNLMDLCLNVDVLCLSYETFYEDGTTSSIVSPSIPKEMNGQSLFVTKKFCTPAQFYIYRREFLLNNNLLFYYGILHEDMEFTPRMLCLAKSINICMTPVYYYYIRSNSIMTTPNPKRSYDLLRVAESLSKFSEKMVLKEVTNTFDYYISICLNNSLAWISNNTNEVIHNYSMEFKKHKHIFKHLLKSPMLKNKIEGMLFSFFPGRSVEIYKVLQHFR